MDNKTSPDRLRVGIVLHDISLGGTERIALRLANHWAGQGAAVTVFCGAREGALSALLGPRLHVVEAAGPIRRGPGSRARLARAAVRYFHRWPVDVCFIPGNFHWPVVPALAQLPPDKRPLIVAQVSAALDKPQRGFLRQALFNLRMRHLLRNVDGLVCLSRRACEQANHILGRNIAITIPLPALDDDVADPVPVAPNCRTFVAAGRLVREKGFDTLIDAFAQLDDPQARLVIIGTGPEEDNLRQRISRHGLLERISLPGFVPGIRPWLDQARAFVLSSHYEGFPAVLIEALAAGRQTIATRCSHAVEELSSSGQIGRVVPIDDPAAMAKALRSVLESAPAEPSLLAATVAGYCIGPIARGYLQVFDRWRKTGHGNRIAPVLYLTRRPTLSPSPPRLHHSVPDLDAESVQREFGALHVDEGHLARR